MKQGRWPGTWKVTCDVCGFEYASDVVKKRWDGLITCPDDWEMRHPQDFIRGVKDDPSVPFARPEPPDNFDAAPACYIYEASGYAGIATAGCARAGWDDIPYSLLVEMKGS